MNLQTVHILISSSSGLFVLKENILLWCSQASILPMTNIFVWWSSLKTCFCKDCLHSNYHTLKRKVFILWPGLKIKYPVYIISQTKCTTNIFAWWSGLKLDSTQVVVTAIIKCLRKKYFVSKSILFLYYYSQVHSKYFCLIVRLENIIPWRLSVTAIYTCCSSIIHLRESMFCFTVLLVNILQFILSGKPGWRSGLKTWFCVDYVTAIIHLK